MLLANACRKKSFAPKIEPVFKLFYKNGQLFKETEGKDKKITLSPALGFVGITDELFPYLAALCSNNNRVVVGAEWRNYVGRYQLKIDQGRFSKIKISN